MPSLLGSIPLDEWIGGERPDKAQVERYTATPEPMTLIQAVADEAELGGDVRWEPCYDKSAPASSYGRAVFSFPVTSKLFDEFFNGPAGYRAHFYRSPLHGLTFNGIATLRLLGPAGAVYEQGISILPPWQRLEQSFLGSWTKIWVVDDTEVFNASKVRAGPARWTSRAGVGGRLPVPPAPKLALYGTLISEDGDPSEWVPEEKAQRVLDLHRAGFV